MSEQTQIRKVETFSTPDVCIVRLTAEDGQQGYGQTAPYHADITATVLHRQVAPLVLGWDGEDVNALVDTCFEHNYKFPWSYVSRATAGIDTALWDMRGKREGKSVCEMLGGTVRPVTTYGSSMRRDISPEDEAQRLVRLRDEKGYGAFKIRIGSVCGHDKDEWPGRTEDLVRAVRKAVGPDVKILVDGNSCYTPRKAIEVGRMLESEGVCHFEEPCPYWELEWTAEVARELDMDVAGGEQDNDIAQWQRMINMHAVDIVQPDICYVGGLGRALRVAQMAHEKGVPCTPHAANQSMVTLFTAHMLAAIPNAGAYLEFSIEPKGWTEGLFSPALEIVDGAMILPSDPGWGVTLSEEWLSGVQRTVSER